jgi:hypothetical protein
VLADCCDVVQARIETFDPVVCSNVRKRGGGIQRRRRGRRASAAE